MDLLPAQIEELLLAAGIAAAPAPRRADLVLALGVEPATGSVRIEARAPEGGPPASGAAADVDVRDGLGEARARELLGAAVPGAAAAAPTLAALWKVFCDHEMLRLEAELSLDRPGPRLARARAVCDDNAIFRNERLARLAAPFADRPAQVLKSLGIDFVELDGVVGLVCVGAGETMATMDLLDAAGARAACFLDVSGGFGPEAMTAALRQVAALPRVRAVLVNVFGGLTRVDRVAESILEALDRLGGLALPLVVRLEGTEAERGRSILSARGLRSCPALRVAVETAAALAAGGAA